MVGYVLLSLILLVSVVDCVERRRMMKAMDRHSALLMRVLEQSSLTMTVDERRVHAAVADIPWDTDPKAGS